jgi:hypothetical protein
MNLTLLEKHRKGGRIFIDRIYAPLIQTPFYWRHEQSDLPVAITAYLNGTANEDQVEHTRAYLEYVIHSPCWLVPIADLSNLRQQISNATTPADIERFLTACADFGIDPL